MKCLRESRVFLYTVPPSDLFISYWYKYVEPGLFVHSTSVLPAHIFVQFLALYLDINCKLNP